VHSIPGNDNFVTDPLGQATTPPVHLPRIRAHFDCIHKL